MFGWFKDKRDRKPTLADLPAEVQLLGGLLKGKQHAENLLDLRMV